MRTCTDCNAEISDRIFECPDCGHAFASAQHWTVRYQSRDHLQAEYQHSIVHHGLVVPRAEAVAPDTPVRLRLVLPAGAGELELNARVLGSVAQPSRPQAPYDVQLQLRDLDAAGLESLRAAAEGEGAASLDALIEELLHPWEPPPPSETRAELPDTSDALPIPCRERLPEELADDLTAFTLHLIRAITKSSYYTAEHREAEQAKVGLYAAFTKVLADRSEITFHAHASEERRSVLVYGIFDEPADLARAMVGGVAETCITRLFQYFEANGLISISFKRALEEAEFYRFVDLLAGPGAAAHGAGERAAQKLAELRIHHISIVAQEDRVSRRHLSWRVEMALTRLKKDLSVIPLYEHLSEEELRRVRLQVFRDVVRPLRQVNLIRELLENCDLVVEEIDELSQANLAEMEAQILASVTEASLPALLEGLAADVVTAKQESEARMTQLLRLTRRVVQRLDPKHAGELGNAFRLLHAEGMLELEELPAFVRQKLTVERNAQAFREVREDLLRSFDAEADPGIYQKYLNFFESILPELLSPADVSVATRIVRCISDHRTAPATFEERASLAETWLERLARRSLGRQFVERLENADHVNREWLLDFARELGDAGIALLFEALRESESTPCRRDLADALAKLETPPLRFLGEQLERRDLTPDQLCDLLSILARVGDLSTTGWAARLIGHDDPRVRSAALRTAAALEPTASERYALAALADRDALVREEASKILLAERSTAPVFFDFCRRTLSDPEDGELEMARRICTGLAGYERGAARARSVELLLSVLRAAAPQGRGWLTALRRSLTVESGDLPVKAAACQALGRLRSNEAVEVLTRLRDQHPGLRQAAQHALAQIAGETQHSSEMTEE